MSNQSSKKKNPGQLLTKEVLQPYSDEDLQLTPEQEEKLKKMIDFFDQYGIDYDQFTFTTKKAYSNNNDQYMQMPIQHDVNKWLITAKNIHYRQKAGISFREAIQTSTNGWKKMEIYDFLNWLKFYDEGGHLKYKYAQVWYENGQPGYFLHVKKDTTPETESTITVDQKDLNHAREEGKQEEKRHLIEKQRSKIIGRLDSAEKLLRSPEGRQFAGDELENLMESIYSLKKKVQLVNKISSSIRLYEDMIVREGNVLKRNGFNKAANLLYALAQSPSQSAEVAKGKDVGGKVPMDGQAPPDPSGAGQSGTMSGLPSTIPGTPNIQTPVDGDQNTDQPSANEILKQNPSSNQSLMSAEPTQEPQAKGIREFISNMNHGNKTDISTVDDILEVKDEDSLFVAEAQMTPPPISNIPPAALEEVPMTDEPPPERGNKPNLPPPPDPLPSPAPLVVEDKEKPLEVSEHDTDPTGGYSKFDDKINQLLSTVTLNDIVSELESISRDYKTRDQPRRLSYVDMMLDSIGLASMFPSLSEAQNKALEANNYISTRVDDMLAKLRGAMASQENNPEPSPERADVAGIKNKLQTDQDKEAKRKQIRKEQENASLEEGPNQVKQTPSVEMEELAPPAPKPLTPPIPKPLG